MNSVPEISAAPYDWRQTMQPERPYLHSYEKSITYKIYMAEVNENHDGSVVFINYEQAAEAIRTVDNITPGVHKIAYLVGWQYDGHDSKYPAWHEFNEALKRPCDACAKDSYMWLYEEAKKYNTTLSVHINMFDAYEESPLWDTYIREGLIAQNEDGSLVKLYVWNNQQSYAVSYAREWQSGYAKKRIDDLCKLLPLQEAGTVHIDALHVKEDLGHGFTMEDGRAARRQILRYWRDLGIDVTSEFLYYDTPNWEPRVESTVGLIPLAYHLSQTLEDYISRPASLVCGMNATYRMKEGFTEQYGALFGEQCDIESILRRNDWKDCLLRSICRVTLRFLYLNTLQRISATVTRDEVTAFFSEGVSTTMNRKTMEKNGARMQNDGDLLVPTPLFDGVDAVVYSEKGCTCTYDLHTILGFDGKVQLRPLTPDGIVEPGEIRETENGMLTITLEPGHALAITCM